MIMMLIMKMKMNLKNLDNLLNKIRKEIYKDLKDEVKVDTGALKRSFDDKIKDNDLMLEMLIYGRYPRVWKDKTEPYSRLRKIYKKYNDKLAESYGKDIATIIKEMGNKKLK